MMKTEKAVNTAAVRSSQQNPMIRGEQATFIWEGGDGALLTGDFNHWGNQRPLIPFERQPDGRWAVTITLPRDAYVEYGIVVDGVRVPDPNNLRVRPDGMGQANHTFWMPDAVDTPLAKSARSVPRGAVTRHRVLGRGYILGRDREVYLYRPAVNDPVPLLVVFDGDGYLRQARLATLVDNLIAQNRIRPFAMALMRPSGLGRTVEYACNDATVGFIVECVLPYAREQLPLLERSGAGASGVHGIMGASLGGLMAFYTALRAPEIFGRVLCQSGAFGAHTAAFPLYYRSVLEDLIRLTPEPPPIRLWLDVGLQEWFIMPNRAMRDLLTERGYRFAYEEHSSGHNYPAWRNMAWRGLEYLFGAG